jgi:hypothetical protein
VWPIVQAGRRAIARHFAFVDYSGGCASFADSLRRTSRLTT